VKRAREQKTALSRLPLHPVLDLCSRQHLREQVRTEQRGQQYADWATPQIEQGGRLCFMTTCAVVVPFVWLVIPASLEPEEMRDESYYVQL